MRITDRINDDKIHISFEVFPPKTDAAMESVWRTAGALSMMDPSFISVTYGAGGGTSKNTVKLASHIQNALGIPSIAHLTCVSSTKEEVGQMLDEMKAEGIQNVMALRGDIPKQTKFPLPGQYHYAYELIREIKEKGDFCIGAACYPEGHPESVSREEDLCHLKEKVDCGVDFMTTQMFFDNEVFYTFMDQAAAKKIDVPVFPGIMPITSGKQVKRIGVLSGAALPKNFRRAIEKFGEDDEAMRQVGIAFATEQIIELYANGVKNVHVYTMNKPETAATILNNISEIIK